MTKRLQRVRDCCGVVPEIVNHLHAPRFTTKLQPPRNTGKTLECGVDFQLWHIVEPRGHRSHRSIAHIEFADERNFESFFPELEPGALRRVSDLPDSLRAIFGEADLDHLRQAIFGDFYALGIITIQEHHSILRNDIE